MEAVVMHDDIVRFISKHHVAALSIRDEEYTWSCCCYYSFIPSDPALLFLSNSDTRHAKLMLQTPYVSGTISRQTKSVFRIQGVQFKGVARITDSVQMRQSYSKRFPFVCLTDAELWTLRLDYVKFTSNIVKFGKKLYWERTER